MIRHLISRLAAPGRLVVLWRTLGAVAALPVLVSPAFAAEPSDLEVFLHDAYYEIEFFVFERPAVMDFLSEERLTRTGPRALPRHMRTQKLNMEKPWEMPIDAMTRACLTFPTLTYQLLSGEEEEAGEEGPVEGLVADGNVGESASAETQGPEGSDASLPVPEIDPQLGSDPQLEFLASMAEYERSLQEEALRWQPSENFQLSREAARVERGGLGRLLFHGRWLQAVPAREAPDPIFIAAGERLSYPDEVSELVGSVGVTLGRYLHFEAELFFHAPGLGFRPVAAAMDPTGAPVIDAEPGPGGGYMVLSESRRMRSTEVHYLDHPKLGVVVRIDPVSFPEALLQRYVALEEGTE